MINNISPLDDGEIETRFNNLLTINGNGFGKVSSNVYVNIGNFMCQVQSIEDHQIKCKLPANSAGSYPVYVNVSPKGDSNKEITFKYNLVINKLSSTQSGTQGGLELRIDGSGFSKSTQITICEKTCKLKNYSLSQISCIVPASSILNEDTTCEVEATENSETFKSLSSFSYIRTITPSITSVGPTRGGTGGGVKIKIIGSNFPLDKTQVRVSISGSLCEISTVSSTQIECTTGSYLYSSIKELIQVFVENVGLAENVNSS